MSDAAAVFSILGVTIALFVSGRLPSDLVVMTIAVAASTAFLTPIGTTTNLMVLGPGEYRFGDYAKVGGPLVALFLVACLFWVPVVWPF